MGRNLSILVMTAILSSQSFAETRRAPKSVPISKTAVIFPEVRPEEIAIQTGSDVFEVLRYVEHRGYAILKDCDGSQNKNCKASQLKEFISQSQAQLSEKCRQLQGESRIAKRYGNQRITSVCYFKEDKSFIEFN